MPLIELKDIYKSFGANQVLAGVDLQIDRGETLVVMGRSGIGKSVTLLIITGLLSPDALMRAIVMLIVAFVVGTIVEQKQEYYDQVTEKNRELSEANRKLQVLNTRLAESGEAPQAADKK
jgi:ABC-type transporter Mla maintaining outer membrane lipid asymmetry ATPase subunit MlaF